ncbi:OPT oligopeptide transporter protein-domain-containing protein [Polychytrium aggregatum]|uniref:OPT oligopeptide transporter protein-domain-containing protein n=1 Tax=Polychytrium aggregatum TaxID=110093 RepID=UPI0022FE3240|nr:OPT oligopeptide transporter protein-domain-containing protein [Polychytrium aggregatum]KAI9202568.1 OPT oligopeptide transporter protein-domain-containing protein [Polychytrium aggregatum]
MQTEETLDFLDGAEFVVMEGEQSSIPEVAATIPVVDDPTLPCITLRFWVISTVLCCFLSLISAYFNLRRSVLMLTQLCTALLIYPLGHLMARLPSRDIFFGRVGLRLNPGPFNYKEHTLIIAAVGTALFQPIAINIIVMLKFIVTASPVDSTNTESLKWYKDLDPLLAILFVFTTQSFGYMIAGLFYRIFVEWEKMWWPSTLVIGNLLHTLHATTTQTLTRSRLKLFNWVMIFSLIYAFVPSYFAHFFQSVALLCLFGGGPARKLVNNPSSMSPSDPAPMLVQMGSSVHVNSGGVLALSFDWSCIAQFMPFYTPLWATLNVLLSSILFTWIVVPLLYVKNFWNAQLFPMYGSGVYSNNGSDYNIDLILDSGFFNSTKYDSYPMNLSPGYALSFGFGIASLAATIVHVLLYHGKEIIDSLRSPKDSLAILKRDVHAKLMNAYPSVPDKWYYLFGATVISFAIFVLQNSYQLRAQWWILFMCTILLGIFIMPMVAITAIAGLNVNSSILFLFLGGILQAGEPVSVAVFNAYTTQALYGAMGFLWNFKLGHYMKVPPRATFVAQIYGTALSSIFGYAFTIMFMSTIPYYTQHDKIYGPPNRDGWFPISAYLLNSTTLIYGLISPIREFEGAYWPLMLFIPIGLIVPAIFYLLHRIFPKWGLYYINWPIIFFGTGVSFNFGPTGVFSALIVAIISQYYVRKRFPNWYFKYNYIFGGALDVGTVLQAFIQFLLLLLVPSQLQSTANEWPNWVLNNWDKYSDGSYVWETFEYCLLNDPPSS